MEDRQLQTATLGYALALCRAITACRELKQVLELLTQGVRAFLNNAEATEAEISGADAADGELSTCRRQLAAAAAAAEQAAGQSPGGLMRRLLYASPAFQALSEVLLTVVAPDWLPRFSAQQRQQLFDVWFDQAPAAVLLTALVSHLSTVQPSSLTSHGARARVTAVSAEEAAGMLAARFAAPASTGVAELLQRVADLAAAGGQAVAADDGSATAKDAEQQEESLAAALASVPERAAAVELPQLEADAFVPAVAGHLLECLVQLVQPEATVGGAARADAETSHPAVGTAAAIAGGTAFVADVLARFCRRGHQAQVAAALLQRLQHEQQQSASTAGGLASRVLVAMPDSSGVDKLLEAVLKAAAVTAVPDSGTAEGSGSGGCATLPLDASPRQDPAASASAAVLSSLLPPAVWRERADARLALTDRLLAQQQRRLLPLPALRGLLLFLSRQQQLPGDSTSQGSSGSGTVLADAAARAAQLWGDVSSVQRLAPPHQAFLTAALCGSLALLGRQQLNAHSCLLPLLLAGITTRLESPLLSVRRQAMRVGQALSLVLDPSKPPMFAEDQDQLQQLLPDEVWDGTGAGTAQWRQGRERGQQRAKPRGLDGTTAAEAGRRGSSTRQQRREQREQRRREREVRRVQRDAEEDEGPLTETDSDDDAGFGRSDDDASSVTSSGTAGSTSSGDMEAFDLEESDDEDPAKSKLQLRDLPKLLLSGAEQDWRGQLRALRHAEYLIRAAPDELEQYTVPLARALIHTKVPGWMDEEMPAPAEQGGVPLSANMQRFRDVVSLLVGAPESAGLALASELYGPSMDVYQRAMIMDGMAAAAAEIAKPGSSLPPLPGLPSQPQRQRVLGGRAEAAAVAAAAAAAGLSPEQQRLLTTTADGSKRVGTVTRLASRSLAAAAARRGGKGQQGHVNRFPPVALKWAAALLKHCDEPQHGIDLLGKDSFLLGKLLVTLGSFLEASAQSSEAATLAAATLELMRCGRVHNHPEPYVRRAALLAAGQVLGAVPPARLATAMLEAAAGGGGGGMVALSAAAAARDAADEALVSRLEWLREWTEQVAAQDTDDSCRMMADGVRRLQANLAAGALAALGNGQPPTPLDGGGLLPLPSGGGGGGRLGPALPAGGLRLPDIRLP